MAKGTSTRGRQTQPAAKKARHVGYTRRVAREICSRIAAGESWRSISKTDTLPSYSTLFHWRARHPEFAEALNRAKDRRAGKPMSTKALQASARQLSDLALETLAKIMEGDGQDRVRLAAAREVLDRAHGKPKPAVTAKAKAPPKAEGMTVIVKRFSDVTPEDEAEADETEARYS